MDRALLVETRLRSHRLSAPAPTAADAAAHLLATQGQDFGGARWALATRTRPEVTIRDVDALFDRGELVRAWTMRGTLHLIPARDLGWVLRVTSERQQRAAAARLRQLELAASELQRAEAVVRAALAGGGRMTRAEVFALLDAAGVSPAGQRGYHVLSTLALRSVVCWGPVVTRPDAPSREQHVVLVEDWIRDAATPADPEAQLFARYIAGHGPAGAADFAWWSGLTLGQARAAAEAAADRLEQVADNPELFVAPATPAADPTAPEVIALPAFDEYYISYRDRTAAADPSLLPVIGPGRNGMVKPILAARGRVVGVWTSSFAVGRHGDAPKPAVLDDTAVTRGEVSAALDRYRRFVTA